MSSNKKKNMSVIESLKVEGNIPCPTPSAVSKPPIPIRRKSTATYDNPSLRPVKIKQYGGEKHVNSEEEIKNILLQAKAPALTGPTIIAKRMGFMSKIKQLNDGMYKHHVLGNEHEHGKANGLTLEGRKVDSNIKHGHESNVNEHHNLRENDNDAIEMMKQENALPHRPVKSSTNSAKSFHSSIKSAKSDSGIQKTLALPSLTIGADRHKTQGEYITQSRDDLDLYGLTLAKPNKDMIRGEQEEYEFRFQTPRKFRLKGDLRDVRTPDSTGNYGSLSLSDLKACLHVNHSNDRSLHQDYIVQNYMEQLKKKHSGFKVNPYKMLKVSPRNRGKNKVSPRYEFNSVESYLKFNRQKQVDKKEVTPSRESQVSFTDTVVLQVMSDLNTPVPRQGTTVTSCPLSSRGDKEEFHQNKPPVGERFKRSKYQYPDLEISTTPVKQEKQVIQHIVYVPSGQTAKVRLLKS